MNLKLRTLTKIAVAALVLGTTGCGRPRSDGKPVAAVTFPQQAALLRVLTGDDYEIITLLPPGSDPESFEPSMATMKALSRADIYFTMGSPGFEESLLKSVQSNFPEMVVVDSSEGIERLEHTHGNGHGHEHGHHEHGHCPSADPHLLTSVRNGRKIAANMAKSLERNKPEHSALYLRRLASLDSALNVADDSLRSILSRGNRPFVVQHPSLSYFENDYGLTQIALEQEAKEPSPRQYAEALTRIDSLRPALFIAERQHASPRLEATARSLGIPVMEVDLNTEDWIENLYQIAEAIRR